MAEKSKPIMGFECLKCKLSDLNSVRNYGNRILRTIMIKNSMKNVRHQK